MELEATGDGMECLRVLNQIIVDFDNVRSTFIVFLQCFSSQLF